MRVELKMVCVKRQAARLSLIQYKTPEIWRKFETNARERSDSGLREVRVKCSEQEICLQEILYKSVFQYSVRHLEFRLDLKTGEINITENVGLNVDSIIQHFAF